ncbi:uncharacterized protein EDB91DRAFT_1115307 [Suillus paluster]|uniref:uncharacterized protein n=1 Tax=Suillus paluster TaxID=48578 RepID=UPI001B8759AA|nr:uncharacterized protein EDB91DRAFT_1115307 [Suillus paluster]KAG1747890.1 hypothetical protein EDB91DRAFT_1115307 [Suillus paluster]
MSELVLSDLPAARIITHIDDCNRDVVLEELGTGLSFKTSCSVPRNSISLHHHKSAFITFLTLNYVNLFFRRTAFASLFSSFTGSLIISQVQAHAPGRKALRAVAQVPVPSLDTATFSRRDSSCNIICFPQPWDLGYVTCMSDRMIAGDKVAAPSCWVSIGASIDSR